MADLKDSWKKTGVGLGHAFRDLGKSIVKSAATAVNKVDDWANKDDDEQDTQAALQSADENKEEEDTNDVR